MKAIGLDDWEKTLEVENIPQPVLNDNEVTHKPQSLDFISSAAVSLPSRCVWNSAF
jgi:hypothetical protein